MPDWTYRTVFRPLLFRLPPTAARRWVLHALRRLAQLPLGHRVIEFFGHMQVDRRLETQIAGLRFPTRIGLASDLDGSGIAREAFSQFGFGFLELGPIGIARRESVWRQEPTHAGPGWVASDSRYEIAEFIDLKSTQRNPVLPYFIRLAPELTEVPVQLHAVLAQLHPTASGWVIDTMGDGRDFVRWKCFRASQSEALSGVHQATVWWGVEARMLPDTFEPQLLNALEEAQAGIWIRGGVREVGGNWRFHPSNQDAVARATAAWRQRFPNAPIIAGGVFQPIDARRLRETGADLVAIDIGLATTGPGLPKRVNEALLQSECRVSTVNDLHTNRTEPPEPTAFSRSWFWCGLLGLGMLWGGSLALAIAATRVVLPYDEVFCGIDRGQLARLNTRLLPFMAHDRISLAGTMITSGILYSMLAWFGVRSGQHWAKMAVVVSATSGFFSFFLFLGFGYFDPFHAFVTSVMFQFLLLAIYAPLDTPQLPRIVDLDESPAWRRGQWGQLIFVLLGVGLVGAGCVISAIGATSVFVREDLEFLRMTRSALEAANARLIPLVAHDRASLGGMLIACGLAIWLTAQWGFRGGARWVWWMLLLAGLPAFAGAIGVHFAVGYTSPAHLLPAFAGLAVFALGLMLSRTWLCPSERVTGQLE